MNDIQPSAKQDTRISTWIAFSLLPLSGFATDIYVPSMPSMATQLATSELEVQSTLTLFLVSYGLFQIFIGSFLDSFGRFRIGLIAMFLFSVASFLIAVSVKIEFIQFMRVIQGITAATVIVAKRAYFVDVYSGKKLKHYLSLFTIIWSVGPITAPFIGGYLQQFFGWQSNFYLLGGLVLICAVLDLIFGKETLREPVKLSVQNMLRIYGTMLKTKSFIVGIAILSFTYSIVMMYNLTGSFIIENTFQMNSVTSGYCSLALGFAWLFGGLISKRTISRPLHNKLNINISIQFGISICMLVISILMPGIITLIAFAFIIQMNTGYTYNNLFIYCLSRFPSYAAMSGGFTGGVVYIFVSVITFAIINIFPPEHMFNLSLANLCLTIASAIAILYLSKLLTTINPKP